MVVAILALILNRRDVGHPAWWAMLIGVAMLVSAGMGLWHMGVEYKWWEGPQTCLAGTPNLDLQKKGADLLASLDKPAKMPGCSEAAWHFLGLSMAGWNMLISLGGAVLSFVSARRSSHV